MDPKSGEVKAVGSENDEHIDCSTCGCVAWGVAKLKSLHLWHCVGKDRDNIVVYRQIATDFTGEPNLDSPELPEQNQTGIFRIPRA